MHYYHEGRGIPSLKSDPHIKEKPWRSYFLMIRISIWVDNKVSKMDSGDSYTTLTM